jgi:phosphopantothenoylcysteine decarboxylase
MSKVLLGVSASISAFRAADIVSALKKHSVQLEEAQGQAIDVHVVMTKNSEGFITPLTLQALSQNYVHRDVLDEPDEKRIVHVNLPQEVDVFCLAPATANVIAKIAAGIADDQLTSMVLAIPQDTPKLIAPAMNTTMLENPATKRNLKILHDFGWEIIEPRVARLACGVEGRGAIAATDTIVEKILSKLT